MKRRYKSPVNESTSMVVDTLRIHARSQDFSRGIHLNPRTTKLFTVTN